MRNPYSASQLGRRWLCPGSAKAEEGLPEVESPEAASGTRIHKAAAVLDLIGASDIGILEAAEAFDLNGDETEVLQGWLQFRDSVVRKGRP